MFLGGAMRSVRNHVPDVGSLDGQLTLSFDGMVISASAVLTWAKVGAATARAGSNAGRTEHAPTSGLLPISPQEDEP